jgi:transketolase
MTSNTKSGHPGGSLSSIDYLSLLYTQIIVHTKDPVIISNGHISPALYAVLAELDIVDKKDLLKNFRKSKSIFEGHVARTVPGVWYGTGPLGIGTSVASGLALAKNLQSKNKKFLSLLVMVKAKKARFTR